MNAVASVAAKKNSTTVRSNIVTNLVRRGGHLLSRLSPALATRIAAHVFLRPGRHPHPAAEQPWLSSARRQQLYTQGLPVPTWDGRRLAVYRWGRAEAGRIVLMHGWGGRATQFASFIPVLVEAGYEVIAVDAPGHGLSEGRQASLLHFANALERVVAEAGPVDAVIAHSFGGAATALAASRGLRFGKAVLIAPPSDLNDYLEAVGRGLGLTLPVRSRLRAHFEALLATPFSALHARALARGLRQPALVIHDEDDREVSLAAGQVMAEAWGARLLTTRGLGHRRILKEAAVVSAALAFIQGRPLSQAVSVERGEGGVGEHRIDRDQRGTGPAQQAQGIVPPAPAGLAQVQG